LATRELSQPRRPPLCLQFHKHRNREAAFAEVLLGLLRRYSCELSAMPVI
jgi:hypothetical protein